MDSKYVRKTIIDILNTALSGKASFDEVAERARFIDSSMVKNRIDWLALEVLKSLNYPELVVHGSSSLDDFYKINDLNYWGVLLEGKNFRKPSRVPTYQVIGFNDLRLLKKTKIFRALNIDVTSLENKIGVRAIKGKEGFDFFVKFLLEHESGKQVVLTSIAVDGFKIFDVEGDPALSITELEPLYKLT
ncbi:hypothetical protein [Sessilibacter corallicola]|uniref:hypothetical protein n=1 Tax=Sessilibacter corallicola TaxID=2904075 RepID=UPI001E301EC4|nr:hypothetical protein [Sessilibacter corallicola]MCE2029059.1 hypothetical protein [Sessilibacter corallicola]